MILDTNALSAIADERASAVAKFHAATRVAIPSIVLGEYRFGILQSRRYRDYDAWLDMAETVCEILPVDANTAAAYASIRLELKQMGKPIPENDLWIAALCRQHDLPLMTLDTHFEPVKGLRLVRW